MPKLIAIDPAFRVALPAEATGGNVELRWDESWRVAALASGAVDRGKAVLTTGPLAGLRAINGTDHLMVAAPVLGDVLPLTGLPYLEIIITPTYPDTVYDPGEVIRIRGRPHETSDGLWDLTDIGEAAGGPVLVTTEQRASVQQVLDVVGVAQQLPQIAADARQAAADARALLQAQQGTLVYSLGRNTDGSEKFYCLDPNNFQTQQVTVMVAGEPVGVVVSTGSF